MKDLVQLFKETHVGNIEREVEITIMKSIKLDEQYLPSSGHYLDGKTKELNEAEIIELKIQRALNKAA
jgi:hypothetical protein